MEESALEPFSKSQNVAIMYQISNLYAPYACVSIASILQHATQEHYYDIIILSHDITETTKRMLKDYLERKKGKGACHVSLRFYDVNKVVESWKDQLPTTRQFIHVPSVLVCSYWFAAEIFSKYEKVIRLGADTMLMTDIARLYNEDIGKNWIGAIRDCGMSNFLQKENAASYYQRKLSIDKETAIKKYINADVQVMNLTEWRKHRVGEKLLRAGADTENGEWRLIEQDVVNYVCMGHIHYFDYEWNCFSYSHDISDPYWRGGMNAMEPEDAQKYEKALKAPNLVHFTPIKPWQDFTEKFGDIWWEYARETPFYEILIRRLHDNQANDNMRILRKRAALKRKITKQRIFTYICLGIGNDKSRKKIAKLEERIREIDTALKTALCE